MATWTPQTKNTSSFTNQAKSVPPIPQTTIIGFPFGLTYAAPAAQAAGGPTTWNNQTKN